MLGVEQYFPVVMVSAVPLQGRRNAPVLGAVISGYELDDILPAALKQTYLNQDREAAFYSKTSGVVGESFTDPASKKLVTTYFNSGTDFITKV